MSSRIEDSLFWVPLCKDILFVFSQGQQLALKERQKLQYQPPVGDPIETARREKELKSCQSRLELYEFEIYHAQGVIVS